MKKYTFNSQEARYEGPKDGTYNSVQHRIINEKVTAIKVSVIADNLEVAIQKGREEFSQIVGLNFGNIPGINFFSFKLDVIEIEELE